MNEQVSTYQAANEVYFDRTNWRLLPLVSCACGNRFWQEVAEQTQCRDCHSAQETGFYAPGVRSVAEIGISKGRW